MKKNQKPALSIVVATHNRLDLLSKCVELLLSRKEKDVEIIIIDGSDKKNKEFSNKDLIYIYTQKRGSSDGRNLGIKKAKGEYIAFIDDDAIAGLTWIKEIQAFIKKHPDVKAFGGGYSRYSSKPLPRWFPPDYGINDLGDKERVLKTGQEWLSGTNMVFKKDLLIELGGFNENLGMKGKKIGYGEETDLQKRIYQKGEKIYYSPQLRVKHLVAGYKQNLWWLLKSSFYSGKNSFASHGRKHNFFFHTFLLTHKIGMFLIDFF